MLSFLRILPAAIFAAGVPGFAVAETLKAVPEQPLQAVLDRAQDGDVIELAPGEYKGAIRIERRVVLTGRPGAVLDGGGAGNVVTVTAPDVTIRGVTIRGSGHDLQTMDSGVFLEKTAERALIENNRFEGNLFGIYVHGATGSRVLHNIVEGVQGGRRQEAGNGVSLWNAPDVTIAENTLPLRPRRHLHDFQPQGPLHQQPLRAGAVRGALHVHQRQRSKRQRVGRQSRRLRHHVFEPADHPQQYQRSRPRLRHAVQLRQLRRDRRQLGSRRLAR